MLDLGCGEGRHAIAAYLEGDVHAIGVDLSLADLQTTRAKYDEFVAAGDPVAGDPAAGDPAAGDPAAGDPVEEVSAVDDAGGAFGLAAASALQLPFADNCFDKVICSEVLEHIPDYRAALSEIERVLKPGGLLCASVPRRWPEKICWALSEEYYNVPGGHVRIFRADELRAEVEKLGFRRYHRHWAHALHVPFWWLKCLFWNTQDDNPLIAAYHRLLVWDLMERPAITRLLEKSMDPLMGKSVVMYFRKGVEL